tara:strand:+ start:21 stop:503 length:483 start_codon:yes stop_codon:yes gene_type:complete
MQNSLLGLYNQLGMNPSLEEDFSPGTVDAPYYGNTRTIMTPTDTITYNTNNPFVGEEGMGGHFIGMDQNNNPIILGSGKLSLENYYDHVSSETGKDWGEITSPLFKEKDLDISGDYLKGDKSEGLFRSKDKDHRYKVYSGEGIQKKFPKIYNKLVDLGYY